MKKLFLFLLMAAFFTTGSVMAQSKSCAKTCTKAQKAACTGSKMAKSESSDAAKLVNFVDLQDQGYAVKTCQASGTKYASKTCGKSGNVTAYESCPKSGKITKTVTCGASGKVLLTETVEELKEGENVVKEAKVKGTAVMPAAAKKKGCCMGSKKACTKAKAATPKEM